MDLPGKVFVTGSTGFIGSKLITKLRERGFEVRGLARRPPESRPGLEYILGDVTAPESLRRGMEGCRYAFHLAAYAKNWARNPAVYDEINIQGTRNVFAAARDAAVERIVWTSTIVTLGPTPPGTIGNEDMPRITEACFTEYERSKTEMEREAAQWVKDGLPLVIVNPTRVYGPDQLTESNSVSILIDDFRRGRFPILLNRGVNVGNYGFVDDVAEGHILAMERGRIGERYILGGENASLDELFRTVERIDGKTHFQLKIYWVIPMLVAYLLQWRADLLGFYPPITPGWVRTFLTDWAFSCEKAKRELGYRPHTLEDGLRKTCQWLSQIRQNKEPDAQRSEASG